MDYPCGFVIILGYTSAKEFEAEEGDGEEPEEIDEGSESIGSESSDESSSESGPGEGASLWLGGSQFRGS